MNKWISRLIIAVLLIGALAGIGITAYRFGFQQGAQTTGTEAPQFLHRFDGRDMPQFLPFRDNHNFGNNRFPMMERGRGFGFFSPFLLLVKVALLGLVIWFGYSLFKGKGWTLSLTRQSVNNESEAVTPKNDAGNTEE